MQPPSSNPSPVSPSQAEKWTEIEHLPEWDEDFYDVYTAKKYGKWVMLKTLKEKYRQDPRFRSMIEKEFDVRYNLAHPNIVMINDLEEVPGVGLSIITDDVYGRSLRKILDSGEVKPAHLDKVMHQLVDAIEYIQTNHLVHTPIRPETIIFTENIENLKLIDVGFDQREKLTPADATEDIYAFGKVLEEVLAQVPGAPAWLRKVAERCTDPDPRRRYRDVVQLRLALLHRTDRKLYLTVIAFLVVMIALLLWLTSPLAPSLPTR
ncbi:MAG: protein kinase [Pseudoflavonifractor sp.]|nr:protein kinase [Pseudoflavonifractor sp.]